MILIENIIIQDEVVEEKFVCNLNACKGACCWEGDYGAPLEQEEIDKLELLNETLEPYLDESSNKKLKTEGGMKYYKVPKFMGTNLHENGACVYLAYKDGIALCSIEQAWKDGLSTLRKPISCHLYPIRIDKDSRTIFEMIKYDQWDICSAACSNGEKLNIRVYEFAKDALIRKYGQEFYDQLDSAAKKHHES